MRAKKESRKKTKLEKIFFYFLKWTFFRIVFLSPEINCFLSEIDNNPMRARQTRTHVFFCNPRPKSNARPYLKQKKT